MVSQELENVRFGENFVCLRCGVPQPCEAFSTQTAVCDSCRRQPSLTRRERLLSTSTPETEFHGELTTKLNRALREADPQLVNGIQRALEILEETPQELAARCLKELTDPRADDGSPLPPEARAAIPKDYKMIMSFLDMLQKAQIDLMSKQMQNQNPYEDLDLDQVRGVILKGTVDYAQRDVELRKQLIRGFMSRCPSFLKEVRDVASELGQLEMVT